MKQATGCKNDEVTLYMLALGAVEQGSDH